jgi:hypothetical protein
MLKKPNVYKYGPGVEAFFLLGGSMGLFGVTPNFFVK